MIEIAERLPEVETVSPAEKVAPPPARRWVALDFLRGLAIILVLGRHQPLQPAEPAVISAVSKLWYRIGWTGVDLFFVLSGFLIGGLIFTEINKGGRFDARRFFVRRVFKIWPSYLLYLLALTAILSIGSGNLGAGLRSTLPNWFHVQNYFDVPRMHTWSLAVEEHFYLALPLLILAFLSSRPTPQQLFRRILTVCLLLLFVCLLLRWLVPIPFPTEDYMRIYRSRVFPTHLRMDSLFVGVCMAALFYLRHDLYRRLLRFPLLWLAGGCLLVSPLLVFTIERNSLVSVLGFTLLSLGYGAALMGLMELSLRGDWEAKFARLRLVRLVAGIGALSYGIYLWHMEPVLYIQRLLSAGFLPLPAGLRWAVVMLLVTAAAVFLGWLSTRIVEQPALKLRDTLFPSRTDSSRVHAGK